jgi:pilus assembly protein Flp/PilA
VEEIMRLWVRLSLAMRDRIDQDESGAAMVEYGLLVGLIAGVCVGILQLLGTHVDTMFVNACKAINNNTAC